MQVFEDIESRVTQPMEGMLPTNDMMTDDLTSAAAAASAAVVPEISPLLVMVYEFERGQGTMEMSIVDTLSCSIKKDFVDFLASSTNTTCNDTTLPNSSSLSSSSSTLAHVDI